MHTTVSHPPPPPSAVGATSWQHRPQFCSVGNLTRGMTCATCPLDRQPGLCLPLRCACFLRVAHQDYRQGMLTLVVSTAAIAANRPCAGAGIRLAFVSSRGSCELARLEKIMFLYSAVSRPLDNSKTCPFQHQLKFYGKHSTISSHTAITRED